MGLYQTDLQKLRDKLTKSNVGRSFFALEAFRHFYFNTTQWCKYNEKRILLDLYLVGREHGLSLFYDEFVSDFWCGYHYDYSKMIEYRGLKKRYTPNSRTTQKYVKNIEHKKHNKQKNAWHIDQKTLRDKAKKRRWKNGPDRYCKKLASRLSRRHIGILLSQGLWEQIDMHEKRYHTSDLW